MTPTAPAPAVVPAMPTVQDPDVATWTDGRVGPAVLWSMDALVAGGALVVPDLSVDLVWVDGDRPRLTDRTVAPLAVPLSPGARSVGLRLPPAVVGVRVDWSWPGWRLPEAPTDERTSPDRAATLRRALGSGAIEVEADGRLDALLRLLSRPDARIPAVAARLGVSQRQLLRWARQRTGLSPKRLHRVLRLRRLCEADRELGLADRATQAGFADHAHACGEVRALAGTTFSELVRWATARSSKTPGTSNLDAGPP